MDYARLNPNAKEATRNDIELPRYDVYFRWGDAPHMTFTDAQLEDGNTYERFYYANGVVIALPG
jgi:hypothetical protein